MKFLLFANVASVLYQLWDLLSKGYTDLHFVAMCISFVAMIMAICMLIEE